MAWFGKSLLCWVALAWVLGPSQTHAQELPPQREHKATLTIISGPTPERTLRLSDEVRIRIEVTGQVPLVIDPGEASGDPHWKIEAEEPRLTEAGALAKWRWELVCVPLQPGDHPIPLPGLSYREGDDKKRYDVKWQPLVFHVLTQIGKADIKSAEDITDIESLPIAPSPSVPWFWCAVVAGVVLVSLAGLVLRRRPGEVALPPERVAFGELDRLARQEPASATEVEHHFRELAQVLRNYLDQHFQLAAQRRTSAELTNELRKAALLTEEQMSMLTDILRCCDLAKFARMPATVTECQAIVARARTLVGSIVE